MKNPEIARLEALDIERYFRARPMALNVALTTIGKGKMTATDLSSELNVSVPTMHRLCTEMEGYGLLKSEKEGKRRQYYVPNEVAKEIVKIAPSLQQALRKKSLDQKFLVAGILKDKFAVPLSLRYVTTLLKLGLKTRVKELLPSGMRRRKPVFDFAFGEKPVFDLILGNDEKAIGVEIKILDSLRSIRESVGALTFLASTKISLDAIIPVYLLYPLPVVGGQELWLVAKDELDRAFDLLSQKNVKIVPIVKEISKDDALDPLFIESLAKEIVDIVTKMVKT